MEKNYRGSLLVKGAVLSAAAFCVAATAAHAQTTAFATGFDGTDTVNGVSTATTYNSPNFSATYTSNTDPTAIGPTAPLASQNGWTSNDTTGPIGHGTVATGNANQINGGTNYVGGIGSFFGGTQVGAIGGIYAPAAQTPYAVPSTTSAGIVSLSHGLTVPATTTQVVFNIDFALISNLPTALDEDSFSFTLNNTVGASIFSISFSPTVSTTSQSANVTFTGASASSGNDSISLNAAYHLKVTLTPGATPTYVAVLTGTSSATVNGTLALSPTTISQLSAVWNLTDKATNANGGLTGAGENYLAFDNISVTVPEPSTYAMLALGLVGLAGMVRLRRQQA